MSIEEVARRRLAQAEQHRQVGAIKDAEALEASVERLYQQAKKDKPESEAAKLRRSNRRTK